MPRWVVTIDETERDIIVDALDLAAGSEGWIQEEREVAERLRDQLMNADRQGSRSH